MAAEVLADLHLQPHDTRKAALEAAVLGTECENLKKGLALYKYHAVPVIAHSERNLNPNQPEELSWHCADLRAGMRWNGFKTEHEKFWAKKTEALFEGDLTPLLFATYEAFVEGDYAREILEDFDLSAEDVDFDGASEPSDNGPAEPATHITQDRFRISEDAQNYTNDFRPRFSANFEPPSQPWAVLPPQTRAAPVIEHRQIQSLDTPSVSPRVCSQSQHVYATVSSLPDRQPFQSSTPGSSAVCFPEPERNLMSNHNGHLPISAKLETSDIERLVAEIRKGRSQHQHYSTLQTKMKRDGYTLFEFHARALAKSDCSIAVTIQVGLGWESIWDQTPQIARAMWGQETTALLNGLEAKDEQVMIHFETKITYMRPFRYRLRVKDTISLYLNMGKQTPFGAVSYFDRPVNPHGTCPSGAPWQIVAILVGKNAHMTNEELIESLMEQIETMSKRTPQESRTKIRWRGIPIHVSLDASGPASIYERLRMCLVRGLTPEDAHVDHTSDNTSQREARFGALLAGWICVNRIKRGFEPFQDVAFRSWEYDDRFKDCIAWADEILEAYRPLESTNSVNIASALVSQLRRRIHARVSIDSSISSIN